MGAEKGPKIDTFSENIVFYVSKLNHYFYVTFRGAQSLICRVPRSLIRNIHKIVELRAGNGQPKKVMELET